MLSSADITIKWVKRDLPLRRAGLSTAAGTCDCVMNMPQISRKYVADAATRPMKMTLGHFGLTKCR